MKNIKLALFLVILYCLTAWTSAQTCTLASCNSTACPNGCTGCSAATLTQFSEGKTSILCPQSGSFCFTGTLTNGVCSMQNCASCSSNDASSCTDCNPVTSANSNSNHCQNDQCYSMSYTATQTNPPPTQTATTAEVGTTAADNSANQCLLSSCNSVNCPNGCANCALASQFTIPNNGSSIEVCPNNASFCFIATTTNNRCSISNCDGCASSDPSSCTNCQVIVSNNANKDWCSNANCYHMAFGSVSTGSSSNTDVSTAASGGQSAINCALLQCNVGDCPNGCDNCSKATSIPVTDGNTAELCPTNGSFCFIATSSNGVCTVSSCTACGSTADSCTGCQAITAQNSVSNFCTNSLCYHMGYVALSGGSVGTSNSNTNTNTNTNSNSNSGSNSNSTNSTDNTTTGTSGVTSGSNGNSTLNLSSIVSSGLSIRVCSFLISFVIGGLVVLL